MKPEATAKKNRYIVIGLVFLSLLLGAAPVGARRLPVKIYTSADGLGSGFVDALYRDSRGFMWFCTRDGLSRFDGSRFVTYRIGEGGAAPGIESIYETRDGMYWISTTGGTYRFDPRDVSPPDTATPRLKAEFVSAGRGLFFEDRAGNLWLTSGFPSRFVRQADGKFVLQRDELDLPPQGDRSLLVFDMDETADGSLWMNSSWGIIRRLPDARLVFYPNQLTLSSGNTSMIADQSGRIWLSRENKIFVLKPEPPEAFAGGERLIIKTFAPVSFIELKTGAGVPMPAAGGEIFQYTNNDLNRFVESSYAKSIFQSADGDVWITAENNLLQFSGGTFQLHSSAEGLPNVMGRMAEDAAGNLWIGGHAGLARLDRQGLVTFNASDGLNSARFFAINEDADGKIYFAGRDFYLSRFDGNKFETVRPGIERNSVYLWTSRFSYRASNGDWWILTNKKLYRFAGVTDFAALDRKAPTRTYTLADGLPANAMFQIFEDSKKNIWVSTRGGGAAGNATSRLKKDEEKFQTFSEGDGLPRGKAFSSAVEDASGSIWLVFYEGGLARFDGERFEFFGKEEGLPDGLLPDLHLDQKGRLWIASTLGGLFRLDDTRAKKPVFARLTTADGLISNNIRTLTEDKFGRIYIGTARGVDRFSPETGRIKHFSVSDGLATDFVVDSHCDREGNLWFATNDGISRLAPSPEEKTSAPRIFLGGLRIAGDPQAVSELGDTEIEKGELAPAQNNLQIDFFGLDYRAGETLQYQYKLEGASDAWSAPTEQRTVTFANLSPGTYRFLVRALTTEGVVSERAASVSFKILPPVYARWWFLVLAALFVTGVIVLLYRYRTARLREINSALAEAKKAEEELSRSRAERIKELERVRTRIATDLHDDIGASLTQIAILSEVAQAQNKNGASEPLRVISNVSNELVGVMSDIVWAINPDRDHLSDLIQRMRRFAADILAAKGIDFEFNAPTLAGDIPLGANLRREVFLIFKESLNNISKHSAARRVRIDFNFSGEHLNLLIRDDGKGFMPERLAPHLYSEEAGGNGVFSMYKRAAEMGGEFRIESKIGDGTLVRLQLPLEGAAERVEDRGE